MKNFLMAVAGIIILNACNSDTREKNSAEFSGAKNIDSTINNWTWPDTLDAVAAAPESHKIVFEDSNIRILQVICLPGKEEAIHTHKYKSMAWFTQSAHFYYYDYELGPNNQWVIKDSAEVKGFPPDFLNKGIAADPEHPHSIKNVGKETFMAYRIEYKKDFKD